MHGHFNRHSPLVVLIKNQIQLDLLTVLIHLIEAQLFDKLVFNLSYLCY